MKFHISNNSLLANLKAQYLYSECTALSHLLGKIILIYRVKQQLLDKLYRVLKIIK